MKTLILVRHAKSDRKNDPTIEDFDRPLNARGEQDASLMAERLAESGLRIDALVSSPALRARSTAGAFSRKLNLPLQTDKCIYEAGVTQLLKTVRSFSDQHSAVILVGHNPGLSEFLRYLTDENYADLPTAGVAVVELPLKFWRYTFEGKGFLKDSANPKDEPFGLHAVGPVLSWRERYRIWQFEHAKQLFLMPFFVVALLIILGIVGVVMHQSTDPAAMPQLGSSSR